MRIQAKGFLITIIVGMTVAIMITRKWEYLIFLMFLICPLMHLFGHQHDRHHDSDHSVHKD